MAIAPQPELISQQNFKDASGFYLFPSDMELSRNAKLDEVTVGLIAERGV